MDEIHFYCIACGAKLTAGAESAGGLCDCPQCHHPAPIPRAAQSRVVPSTDVIAIEIKFRTACCGTKVRVDSRSQGLTFNCPNCQAQSQVPVWNGLPSPSSAKPGGPAPVVRLSEEEYAFLSAPFPARGAALVSTDN
jgi:predicted RNA-binding Zn-ribbon protein involved in translation (DUF1610 family)